MSVVKRAPLTRRCYHLPLLAIGVAVTTLLLLLAATPAPTTAVPTINPTLFSSDALPVRRFASCAYDIHTSAAIPRAWLTAGINATTGALTADTFASSAGFSTAQSVNTSIPRPIVNTGAPFLARTGGNMVYLGNGNLVLFGGATGSTSAPLYIDVVYASSDSGASWSQSTNDAAWTVRSNASACAMPGTNRIVMCGGQSPNGAPIDECWTSNDGVGAVWTRSSVSQFTSVVGGACVGLYDSALYGGSTPDSTMLLIAPSGTVYRSTNLGVTFVTATSIPFSPAASASTNTLRFFVSVVADRANNVFVLGGGAGTVSDSNVYMTSNAGNTWVTLQPAAGASQFVTQAGSACLSLWYQASTATPSSYTRVLSVYGGSIVATGSVAVRSAQILLADELVSLPATWPAPLPSYAASLMPVANHTQAVPDVLPLRRYPSCAYDIHTNASIPRMFFTAGQNGSTTTAQNGDTYMSVDGWQLPANVTYFPRTTIVNTGSPFVVRRAGGMVYLANGNLVLFGGKTVVGSDANVYLDLVYYSPNYGRSWWQATNDAAWTVRSDFAYCGVPGTNRILMCGGQVPGGGGNDCWTSTDGIGAVWTQQSIGQFAGFNAGTCVGLYDSTLFGGPNPNSTVVVITPTGTVHVTRDYGVTFTTGIAQIPFTTGTSTRNFLNSVVDRLNNIYVVGGQSVSDGNVYYSPDDGYSWYRLPQVAGNGNNFLMTGASTSCMAMMVTPVASSSLTTQYYTRELIVYGGTITLSNSAAAESTRITLSGVPTALPATWPAAQPSYEQQLMPVANHTQAVPDVLPLRRYPSCAYDIHTNATVPRMFFTAGQNGSTTSAQNGDTYMSVDGWQSLAGVTYFPRTTIVNTGAQFVIRRAGGMVFLANGNLVMFGGKTYANGDANTYVDMVYYSNNFGRTWSQATNDAAWTVRSDFAYCGVPGTNRILMCGGQVPGGSGDECWTSTDGIGLEWTLQSAGQFPAFSAGTCVALYDSTLYGGPNQASTVLLILPTGPVYRSFNYGVTFSYMNTIPFTTGTSTRNFLNAVVDRLNNIYVVGGQSITDGNVYYSPDDGFSWYHLPQVAGNGNNFLMTGASTSCMATMLTAASTSSTGTRYYTRELIVYGGTITLSNSAAAESTRITLSGSPVTLPTVWPASLPSHDVDTMPVANYSQTVPDILPLRRYPSCAYDIHTNANIPRMFFTAGQNGSTTTAQNGDTYVSVDGWQSPANVTYYPRTTIINTGAPFVLRRAGGMVYLANGNLVLFGGKTVVGTDANVYLDLVYYSSNYGQTWWQSTNDAAWTVRSDFAYCAVPGTTRILMCGGQVPGGSGDDCWTSTDGIGAVWTQQSIGQFPGFNAGTCVALYDSTLYGGPNANNTVILIAPTGPVYLSRNYGVTFTNIATIPFVTGTAARNFLNSVADRLNNIYVLGGQSVTDGNVYYSPDDGYTWYRLTQVAGNANSATLLVASTSCMAAMVTPSSTSASGTQYYARELVVYGGTITLSTGAAAESTRITLTGSPVTAPTVWPAPLPSYDQSLMPVANHTQAVANLLPVRRYPSCAWDVHTNTSIPRMFMIAGQTGGTTTAQNGDTYMSIDGWQSTAGVVYYPGQPIVNTGAPFVVRRAGGTVFLANGNLVMFGGKTVVNGDANTYMDLVYYSADYGQTWWQATNDAAWTPRSDLAYCAMPGTNRIMMCAGQVLNGQGNECWTSTDGIGRDWTMQSAGQFPSFSGGTCVGLYDSTMYGGPNANNTLMLISPTGGVYVSRDFGVTFTTITWIPFVSTATRGFLNAIVDRSSNIYVLGGYGVTDGNVYYSPNDGYTWYRLTAVAGNANSATLASASTSCAGFMYTAVASGSLTTQYFTREIVVYGGAITLSTGLAVSSTRVTLSNVPVSLPTVWPNPLPPYALTSALPFANHTLSLPGILPLRQYPSCAYDIHTSATVPRMWMTAGQNGSVGYAQNGDTYMSVDGWTSMGGVTYFPQQPIVNTGRPFVVRRAGSMVYLANGNLVMFGGKTANGTDGGVYVDVVYYSSNYGQSWRQATDDAAWTVRSDAAACAIPGTNRIMMCGGQVTGGTQTSECWTSTDGIGRDWTLQSSNQLTAFQSGACAGLYDSSLYGNASSTSTLIVISNSGAVYSSANYGVTFAMVGTIAFTPAGTRNGMSLVVDRSNNLYVVGGQGVTDGDVYYSPNLGVSWYTLFPLDSNANGGVISMASSSCMAMWFAPQRTTQTATYYDRTLVVYGGQITLADSAAAESVQITLSNAPVTLPNVWPGPLPPWVEPAGSSGVPLTPSSAAPTPVVVSSSVQQGVPPPAASSSVQQGVPPPATSSSVPFIPQPTTSSSSGAAVVASSSSSDLSGGAIAGIVIGVVVCAIIILVVLVFVLRNNKSKMGGGGATGGGLGKGVVATKAESYSHHDDEHSTTFEPAEVEMAEHESAAPAASEEA